LGGKITLDLHKVYNIEGLFFFEAYNRPIEHIFSYKTINLFI